MNRRYEHFRNIFLVDTEFISRPGERPEPVCMVYTEVWTGQTYRVWLDDLLTMKVPPWGTDGSTLFVAYYSSAELGFHLALGWPMPAFVLDLYTEFRAATNGLPTPAGRGLLGAMVYHGLTGITNLEKEDMRALILRGGPWTGAEVTAILDYCASDVQALAHLLPRMLPGIDFPRALLRGRFMKAVAWMEHNGVPIDTITLGTVRKNWTAIQDGIIARTDAGYGVFDGRTFKADRWKAWVNARGIPWPEHERSGQLKLDDDTFKDMARSYPEVQPMHELRTTLAKLRLEDLAIGSDGRNRCLLSPFAARTGRNAPSTAAFIFGPARWIRYLIQPPPGQALAYIDWCQQEFGIAAALSGDPRMLEAYRSVDPYLQFAIQAGAVPAGATRESHPKIREQFKQCALGVLYGMGVNALAARLGGSPAAARDLLRKHKETYPTFWKWSDATVDHAMLHNEILTEFGWPLYVTADTKAPSLRNYAMQANGAEMLRLACCFATEQGIRVCAPVHDALLIEAPLSGLDEAVEAVQAAMASASRLVLGGFELRTDVKIIRHPDRYEDERGGDMWRVILEELGKVP